MRSAEADSLTPMTIIINNNCIKNHKYDYNSRNYDNVRRKYDKSYRTMNNNPQLQHKCIITDIDVDEINKLWNYWFFSEAIRGEINKLWNYWFLCCVLYMNGLEKQIELMLIDQPINI